MPESVPATALPFISREPARGAQWDSRALQMNGLEIMRAQLERRLPEPPITVLTGLRVSDVSLGKTTFAMPASPWWQTGAGVFLAGTLAFVADAPLGCAILTGAPAGVGLATSELSISFLRPGTIRSQVLIGRGSIIHATRSLGLSEAYVEDGRGRLLAHATSRCVLAPIPPIATDRPAATAFSPLDLKVNFLRPVAPYPGELVARARIVHRGRTIAVATCEIVNAEGKTVALATASVLILPGRSWDRPVYVEDELTSAGGA